MKVFNPFTGTLDEIGDITSGVSSVNGLTGDVVVVGDGVTITGTGSIADPFVAVVGGGDINDGGNAFGASIELGTTDNFSTNIIADNITRIQVNPDGQIKFIGVTGATTDALVGIDNGASDVWYVDGLGNTTQTGMLNGLIIPASTNDTIARLIDIPTDNTAFSNGAGYITLAEVPAETDPVFSASEASLFIAGDKNKLDGLTQYTDEMAQDAVGGMVDTTLTYTDGTPELKVTNPVTPALVGFTITAGTTPKTLTVALDASVSGTNTGDQTNITGNAGTVTVADAGGDTTMFPLLGTDATGSLSPRTDSGLTYNATTNELTAGALALAGTAGAGYLKLVGQSSNPTSPPAGTLLLHSATVNGFTRMEQDNEAGTNLIYGRDTVFVVKNTSGGSIVKGSAVYQTGTASGVPTVAKARANSATTLPAIGIVMDTIADNGFGQCMYIGILTNIDTSTFSENDTIWVSTATAGAYQNTRPSGTTNLVQKIGKVLSQNATTGSILIEITPFIGNQETGTTSATWTGSAIVGTTVTTSGDIELGHASDTTLHRVSAGVVSIEGSNILTASTGLPIAGGTMTGNITLGENTAVVYDPVLSADGKYTGIVRTGTAGYTQAFGDLVYLDPTDSRWEACDANSAQGADGDSRGIIGMVVSAGTDGNACTILLHGVIRADAKFPTFTVNNPIYVSETAGSVTQTQPTTTDVVIRIVGFGLTADEMFFNPSNDYTTHT